MGEVVVRADIESVEGDEALVKIRVTDTGIGMDAAAIGKFSSRSRRLTKRRRASLVALGWDWRFAASWLT